MLRKLTFAALFGGLMFALSAPLSAQDELAIGDKAPLTEFKMTNIDGQDWSLVDLAGENGTLVIFTCNTCPFVVGREGKSEGWEGRYNETGRFAKENGVAMVLVNSNEAKRDNHDSMDAMKAHAKENNYGMPYLLDANHKLADAFGAMKTPHVYLFDGDMNLVYRGSIDDNVSDAKAVSERYVQDAITAVTNGTPVGVAETKAIGCSIKRVSK